MKQIEATIAYDRRTMMKRYGTGPFEPIDIKLSRVNFLSISKKFASGTRARVVARVSSIEELRSKLGDEYVADLSNQKFVPF